MAIEEQVRIFLNEFKTKMQIWDVLFRDDRGKNAQTLAELELGQSRGRKYWKH